MRPAEDIEDTDPGMARERTELAWDRTAISFAALGGAILRSRPYAGIAILVVSALIWELGRLARPPGVRRSRPWHLLVITVAVTGVSVVALAISLLGPESGGLRP
jgi:uncharacterized membrane protein YidH (DUF202 family)